MGGLKLCVYSERERQRERQHVNPSLPVKENAFLVIGICG